MKSYAALGLIGLAGVVLSGCPIYPRDQYCYDNYDCPADQLCSNDNVCVAIPTSGGSGGSQQPPSCSYPDQCGVNSICGDDGFCHTGDCHFWGCVAGYQCVVQNDAFVCVKGKPDAGVGGSGTGGAAGAAGQAGSSGEAGSAGQGGSAGEAGQAGSAGEGGSAGTSADAGPEGGTATYCGNPDDCQAGQVCTPAGTCQTGSCATLGCINGYVCSGSACVPANPSACIVDPDCSALGANHKCVNGVCTGPDQLCTDKTQCPGGNLDQSKCVDGKCVDTCTPDAGASCSYGFVCNATLGICEPPPDGCAVTDDCGNLALVCVAGACVQRCLPGGTCPSGQVCVANGCIPDQKPQFDCTVDGAQDVCASTSICLHHHCYISCASPNELVCDNNPPELNVCKTVTTSSGQHSICGSNANLGSECDPSAGTSCTGGKICIDGFCL